MGYRSDVVIAISKEARARQLIAPHIPQILLEDKDVHREECTRTGALYFRIQGWKWYNTFPEIQAIEAWFETLADEEFGAIRMGEDDDDQERWGQPYDFDLYIHRWISSPVDD